MIRNRIKTVLIVIGLLISLYLALLIPDGGPRLADTDIAKSFVWDQDNYWSALEAGFRNARAAGCDSIANDIALGFDTLGEQVAEIESKPQAVQSVLLDEIEVGLFELAVLVSACPSYAPEFINLYSRLRGAIKAQSVAWDVEMPATRDRLYRLLYGGRAAVEEIMMQAAPGTISELVDGHHEPSATPSAEILEVTIHSGDILVSRGGAPTSALIARGNDHPGNFSHVALVHVDSHTGQISIIESHIEIGVAVASLEQYLQDTKLRIMVLRPRFDLPAIQADPMLPHRAAEHALQRARNEHIPYDFAMNFGDSTSLFCSEVVSEAYARMGVSLWKWLSNISSPGTRLWLACFGVENFRTQEPSDLEYDPQLRIVAEWRDYETLLKDRLDNAVVDVMLETADEKNPIDYDLLKLPLARLVKGYSMLLNLFDIAGPVPEGMSATAALRNTWFSSRHAEIKSELEDRVRQFQQKTGYSPPYWALYDLATGVRFNK